MIFKINVQSINWSVFVSIIFTEILIKKLESIFS